MAAKINAQYDVQKNGVTSVNGKTVTSATNQTAAQTNPTKPLSAYQAEALKLIQKPGAAGVTDLNADVRERNSAITGAYADLYLKNPEAFVWIGAAAYASGQVGFAMDQAIAMPDMTNVIDPTGDFTAAAGVIGMTTDNIRTMLAKGNITIFQNIYPASLAYQQGGIEELRRIENSITDKNERARFSPIVRAYEMIDDGVQLNKQQPGSGDQKIKDGTNQLIQFEQKVVLQPIFDEYKNTVRLITPAVFGDLDADDTKTDGKTFARFYQPVIVMTEDKQHAAPMITNLGTSFGDADTRVNWIKDDVFPLWDTKRRERFSEVQKEMQTIVERGRAAGGQY